MLREQRVDEYPMIKIYNRRKQYMKRKCMMSAALMSFMLVITTGCGGRESENAPSMPPGAEQVEEDAKILETGN